MSVESSGRDIGVTSSGQATASASTSRSVEGATATGIREVRSSGGTTVGQRALKLLRVVDEGTPAGDLAMDVLRVTASDWPRHIGGSSSKRSRLYRPRCAPSPRTSRSKRRSSAWAWRCWKSCGSGSRRSHRRRTPEGRLDACDRQRVRGAGHNLQTGRVTERGARYSQRQPEAGACRLGPT